MTTKGTTNTLRILIIILALFLVGMGTYTYQFYTQVKANDLQLQDEKALILKQLEEEIEKYEVVLSDNDSLATELNKAKKEIIDLKAQINKEQFDRKQLLAYQRELYEVRKERELLFEQNDSLMQETQRLASLQKRTETQLAQITKEQDSLLVKTTLLENQVKSAAQLALQNVHVRGVIQRNSGKFLETSRASRAEMIHICFDLPENELAPAQDLPFYTQVLGTDGAIIGVARTETVPNGEKVTFNTKTIVPYNKQSYSVCELVLPVQTFKEGSYVVNIYQDERLVSSKELLLN